MEFKSQCLWKQTYKIIHKNNENGTENKVIGRLLVSWRTVALDITHTNSAFIIPNY